MLLQHEFLCLEVDPDKKLPIVENMVAVFRVKIVIVNEEIASVYKLYIQILNTNTNCNTFHINCSKTPSLLFYKSLKRRNIPKRVRFVSVQQTCSEHSSQLHNFDFTSAFETGLFTSQAKIKSVPSYVCRVCLV